MRRLAGCRGFGSCVRPRWLCGASAPIASCCMSPTRFPVFAVPAYAREAADHLASQRPRRPWWAIPTYGRLQALHRRADCVIVSNPVPHTPRSFVVRDALRDSARRGPAEHASLTPAQLALAGWLRASGPALPVCGRFVYYKGLEVLLDAMARWRRWFSSATARSPAPSAAGRARTRPRIVAGRAGPRSPAYYHASDVFVPRRSPSETYGLVQIGGDGLRRAV